MNNPTTTQHSDMSTTLPDHSTTLADVIKSQLTGLEIPAEPSSAPATTTYEDLHRQKIATLRKEAMDLPAIIDSATYEANQRFRTRLVGIRTGIDKARKAITAPLRDLKARVDGYLGTSAESGLQAEIAALEGPIKARQEAWDQEQERIRVEAANKIRERNEARGRMLIERGMQFDGAAYVMLDLQIFPADMFTMSDEAWGAWMAEHLGPATERWKAQQEAEAERRRQKEEAQREENERQRAEFERQRLAREKLDRDMAELDREKEALKQALLKSRMDTLIELGAVRRGDGAGDVVMLGRKYLPIAEISTCSVEKWHAIVDGFREERAHVVAQRKEEQRLDLVEQERAPALLELGAVMGDDGVWTLGDQSTTRHIMRTSTSDQWHAVVMAFRAAWTSSFDAAEPPPRSTGTPERREPEKTYLGDSVYASFDGWAITLTTENGMPDDPSNTIVMEPGVVDACLLFINAVLGEKP